jgi:uncharacterized protein
MSALPRSYAHRGLSLLVERAAWHAPSRTLWVADVHLGKAATYRALGQPAPTGTTRENLNRLTALVEARQATRLVFLGDLFHARQSYAAVSDMFLTWRARHRDLAIVLVRGNHDLRAGDPAPEMHIEMASEPYASGKIEGRHVPLEESEALRESGATVLAGHIHPTIRLRGPGRDSMRFPCFALQGRQVILPAFGEFTGGAAFSYGPATGVCAITEAGLIVSDRRGAAGGA